MSPTSDLDFRMRDPRDPSGFRLYFNEIDFIVVIIEEVGKDIRKNQCYLSLGFCPQIRFAELSSLNVNNVFIDFDFGPAHLFHDNSAQHK